MAVGMGINYLDEKLVLSSCERVFGIYSMRRFR